MKKRVRDHVSGSPYATGCFLHRTKIYRFSFVFTFETFRRLHLHEHKAFDNNFIHFLSLCLTY